MYAASTNPPCTRLRNVVQMTTWTIGAFAIWIAEILVLERWGYVTSVKLTGVALVIAGIVLMGVGLRRLKIASHTNGTEYSYWRGLNAVMLSTVLISGVSIGEHLYFQKAWQWYMPPPSGSVHTGF